MPILDELCATYKPDMLCLVETWLCTDISNNEIMIPGCQQHWLDRNRHGGGILLEEFVSPTCHTDNNLEFPTLAVS